MNSFAPPRRLVRRALRLGLSVSLFVHCCLLMVLVSCAYQSWQPHAAPHVISVASGVSDHAAASGPDQPPPVRVVDTLAQVTADVVEAEIDKMVARAQQLPEPDQLNRLDRIGRNLQHVSDEESLEELAAQFQHWLGYQPRASEPLKQTTIGEFDHETAQLHDVLRSAVDGQPPRYTAILLDAEGRTLQLDLSQPEGETAYQLMQKIKANPLLERIYRKIAMPLLDQFIRVGQAASELSVETQEQALGESQ